MDAIHLSQIALRAIATVLGSIGILCEWFSNLGPLIALHAIVCLSTAAAITVALGYFHDQR